MVCTGIRTGLPNTTLVVSASFRPQNNPSLAIGVQQRDWILDAAEPYAHLLIDPVGGPMPYSGNQSDYVHSGWLTGTGNAGHLIGDGNSDILVSPEGNILNQLGHNYIAYRMAERISLLV